VEADFRPRSEVMKRTALDWENLSATEYDLVLRGSAMRRAGRDGIQRNAQQIRRNRLWTQ
jgi:epoxyqueuosine reductase QueG